MSIPPPQNSTVTVWCESTQKLVELSRVAGPAVRAKYLGRTFNVTIDPWRLGQAEAKCPHCGEHVILRVVTPRRLLSHEEALASALKSKKVDVVSWVLVATCLLVLASVALYFRTAPILWAPPLLLGVLCALAGLNGWRSKVTVPDGPQVLKEYIDVSSGHRRY
jgi:hypothetical protein